MTQAQELCVGSVSTQGRTGAGTTPPRGGDNLQRSGVGDHMSGLSVSESETGGGWAALFLSLARFIGALALSLGIANGVEMMS